MDKNINNFKEYRVGVVVDTMEDIDYRTCSDSTFLTKAEEQGNTWSLQGFQNFLESGRYNMFSDSIQHPNYMIVRFIPIYQKLGKSFEKINNNPNPIYCNDEDTLTCQWCGETVDRTDGKHEEHMGFLCDHCIRAIESRGETLTFLNS